MLTALASAAILAGITFIMYGCGVRESCRWLAWLAALIMGAASFGVLRLAGPGPVAGLLLENMMLLMVAMGLLARRRFGRQLAGRHSLYREHRIRHGLF